MLGLESLILPTSLNLFPFYFGEAFYKSLPQENSLAFFDKIQFTGSPFSIFGDMYVQPYLATPHDDHNWSTVSTLEKNYFNSFRLERSASDYIGSDFNKFWMVEPGLFNFFGELVEQDLYYGWSHSVLIDTQTYFDHSPYALTNFIGDGFMKHLVTDVFNIFVGPSELDESTLLNLRDWGASYVPGSSSNRVSAGESSGLENDNYLNPEQKSRENGESFHEWFPGLYILDGRFDSKFFLFFLRFFLLLVVPSLALS